MLVFIARQLAMHVEHDVVMANLTVCPSVYLSIYLSVCLSVTFWYCIEMDAHVGRLFTPSGKDMTLSFFIRYKIPRRTPLAVGVKYNGMGENFAISNHNRRRENANTIISCH